MPASQQNLFGAAPAPRSFDQDALGFLIQGFGEKYRIRDGGDVSNLETGKPLTPQITRNGYVYVQLWHDKKKHGRFVHRLLLQAASGMAGDGLEVNHIDGDKSNNTLANLEWVTSAENKKHSFHVLNNKPSILLPGGQNPNAKPIEGIDAHGEVVVRFTSAADARAHGYKPASIAHAISGLRQKRHKGLYWRHAMGNGSLAPGWVAA